MSTHGQVPRRNYLVGGALCVVLLLVGVSAGLLIADRRAPPESTVSSQQVSDGADVSADMDGMVAIQEPPAAQDMEGMASDEHGTIRITRSVAGALGVTAVPADFAPLRRAIRATGHVTWDETRLSTVTLKFSGWIERLHVDFTGQLVQAGDPLFEVYSPDLVSAQEELLAAGRLEARLAESVAPGVLEGAGGLVAAARRRLLQWDISPEQIRNIEEAGEVRRTITLFAPTSGFVVEKNVDVGTSVESGASLFRLADLSRVWLEVDVYESDLRFVRTGESVDVRLDAYPGEAREGRVSYVYPDMDRGTRTARVRVEVPNPDHRLKPGMFATVYLDVLVAEGAVLVPRDAVMRGGDRNIVFIEIEPGTYAIREVQVGATSGDRTEILEGLVAGERVVARANFILDAESRLMETMAGQPGMSGLEMESDVDMEGMEMEDSDPAPSHEH